MLTQMSLFALLQTAEIQISYKRIWVALSGGVDSTVLLDLARHTFKNIHAIHINHQQSPLDSQWQEHCVKTCAAMQIPLKCIAVDMTRYVDQSMELAARNARRDAWQQILGIDDLLLLAHHADDQAETILYRLLRGSGPRGLVGMRKLSKLGAATIMRPLLTVTKQEILNYAKEHNLQWLEDTSNCDTNMDRNFLRHKVMPLLQTRWPAMSTTINRTGIVCSQLLQTLQPKLQQNLESLLHLDGTLKLAEFAKHTTAWQKELLRAWLKNHNILPSAKHMDLILQEVIQARLDASPSLKIGNKLIKRANSRLFILPNTAEVPQTYTLPWDGSKPLTLPGGEQLDLHHLFNPQQIANLQKVDLSVRCGVIGRKAKKLFQAHAIPPWERHKYPLVFANDRLVGIVGLWSSPRL